MSSLTNVSIRNAPPHYWPVQGYAAWRHPRGFEPAKGFTPLLLQTINTPWRVEHPKIITWATLLWTGYGAKRNMRWLGAIIPMFTSSLDEFPLPLGMITAFLCGANIDEARKTGKWKYVLPALAKIYGVDPIRNSFRDNMYPEDVKGFMIMETFSLVVGWFTAYSNRRHWGGSYYHVAMLVALLFLFFGNT